MNWKTPGILQAVTKVLLKDDYNVEFEMPSDVDRLCPTITNRTNYIHWIEDLLAVVAKVSRPPHNNSSATSSPSSSSCFTDQIAVPNSVRGIDIGTGASCIYPLLGASMLGWSFLATDIDPISIQYARANVDRNQRAGHEWAAGIEVRHNKDPNRIFADVVLPSDGNFDFSMCNPPFFADEKSALAGANPNTNRVASLGELVCEGGEVSLLKRMIDESVLLGSRVAWYTSMVGCKSSLKPLLSHLRALGVPSSRTLTTTFVQGRTHRWGLAWTFLPISAFVLQARKPVGATPTPLSLYMSAAEEGRGGTIGEGQLWMARDMGLTAAYSVLEDGSQDLEEGAEEREEGREEGKEEGRGKVDVDAEGVFCDSANNRHLQNKVFSSRNVSSFDVSCGGEFAYPTSSKDGGCSACSQGGNTFTESSSSIAGAPFLCVCQYRCKCMHEVVQRLCACLRVTDKSLCDDKTNALQCQFSVHSLTPMHQVRDGSSVGTPHLMGFEAKSKRRKFNHLSPCKPASPPSHPSSSSFSSATTSSTITATTTTATTNRTSSNINFGDAMRGGAVLLVGQLWGRVKCGGTRSLDEENSSSTPVFDFELHVQSMEPSGSVCAGSCRIEITVLYLQTPSSSSFLLSASSSSSSSFVAAGLPSVVFPAGYERALFWKWFDTVKANTQRVNRMWRRRNNKQNNPPTGA